MQFMAFVSGTSASRKTIVNEFLEFTLVERATGKDLSDGKLPYLENVGLDRKKMLGFGSDGAANMIGGENGMFADLRIEVSFHFFLFCSFFMFLFNACH